MRFGFKRGILARLRTSFRLPFQAALIGCAITIRLPENTNTAFRQPEIDWFSSDCLSGSLKCPAEIKAEFC
jgi:hypothetical protein